MNDEKLRAAYALLLEERAGRGDCVSAEALVALVAGKASESDRLATLRHVAECRHCQVDLDLLRTASDVAQRVARPVWRSPAYAVAASVLLLLGTVAIWRSTQPTGETMRGAATALRLQAPAANAAASLPVTLRWTAVPNARRYNVEVLRADGSLAYQAATTDTTVDLPVQSLAPNAEYRWWVRALLSDGAQPRSETRRLRITAP